MVANSRHDYNPFGDSSMAVTVRNVGGDGRVKVTVTTYRDKEATKRIGGWSTVVYLPKGQETTVAIPLRGLSAGAFHGRGHRRVTPAARAIEDCVE